MTIQEEEDPIEASRRRFAQALATGAYENPDRLAEDRREAAARGLPVSVLRDARAAGPLPPLVNFHALQQNAPRTIDFLSDPRNAAVAQDDIENLSGVERIVARIGERTVRLGQGLVRTALTAVDAPADFLEERLPLGTLSFENGRIVRRASTAEDRTSQVGAAGMSQLLDPARLHRIAPGTTWEEVKAAPASNVIAYALEEGVVSLPDMAAAVFSLPLYVTAQTGNIGQDRAENDGREEATLGDLVAALPPAAASALLERIGTRGIIGLDDVLKSGLRGVPAAAGSAALKEGLTEAGQGLLEYAGATVGTQTGFDPVTALDQMAAGAVAGAPFGGSVRAVTATIESQLNRSANAQAQRQRAESGARMVEQLGVLSAASKLNAREAQTFQQFVDMAAEDGDVTDVYIASETLFQSANETDLDLDALAAAVPHVAEQIRSGASDIRMTVGEYTAHVAGTQANAALLDHLRTDPLGMSRADAREQLANLDETIQQDFSKAFERSAETEAAMASRDTVATEIARKLNTTGRFTSDVNQRYGMIVANFYATLGARRGMSAEQMAELLPLGFDAELPGTKQDNTLSQEESVDLIHFSSMPGIKTSDPSRWGSAGVTPEGERQRRNAGAPGRTYFGVQGVYNGEPETGIRGRSFRYRARVPASKLYDFDADPQGLKPTEGTAMEIATAYEKAIQAAGFSGYRSDALVPGAVALFDATAMEQEGPVRTVQDGQRLAARMQELAYQDRLARLAASTDPEEIITTRPAEDFREQALSELFGSSYAQGPLPDEHPDRVSTRLPTTKGAKEDPVADKLVVSTEAMGKKPSVLEHNTKLVSNYPGVRTKARSAQGRARAFIDHVKANLLALYDRVPAETRERSKQWYDGARALTTVWASRYGLPDRSVAAVLAALSPQKDWYQNVSLAERVLDVWSKRQDYVYDEAMEAKGAELFAKYPDLLAKLRGKSLAELEHLTEKAAFVRIYDQAHNPRGFRVASPEGQFLGEPSGNVAWGSLVEIAKAVSVLEAQHFENISSSLGDRHKVRNFYNNIISPRSAEGDVTIDTHAVAAGLLRALSGADVEVFHNFGTSPLAAKQPDGWVAAKNANEFGVSGTYGLYADAYREAAAERGLLAREMQSITWEAVRGLFSAKFKANKKNVKAINDLWLAHGKGDASLEETINEVIEYAGGIAEPSWNGPGSGLAVAERQASYDGELSRVGLPGRGGADGGTDGGTAGGDPAARVFNQGPLPRTVDAYFSPENIGSLLEKDDWAILTAANPQGQNASAAQNEAANAKLAADLEDAGYDFQPSVGRYGQIEPGFTVVGITEKQARELGDRYNQHSVLTHKGVIYQDGHIDVAVGLTQYDSRPEDYFTEVPGTGVLFALDIPNWREGGPQMPAVGTPAFKSWFGGSVVKNEAGDPLVVYHGTPYDFNSFRGDGVLNMFTPNAEHASFFARGAGSTMPVYLSIQNPLEITQQQLEDRLTEEQADDGMLPRDLLEEIVAEAVAAGNDGVIVRDFADLEYTEDLFIPVQPTQIKSTLNRGFFDPNELNILYQSDPFYSALERAVADSPLTKAPAAQWMATLSKTPGVKKEEIEITGLQDYLDGLAGQTEEFKAASSQVDAKGNITKEAVLGFVRANGVQLEETVLGAPLLDSESPYYTRAVETALRGAQDRDSAVMQLENDGAAYQQIVSRLSMSPELRDDDGGLVEDWAEQVVDSVWNASGKDVDGAAQFSNYKLPGADDTYREILLSLPDVEGPSTHWDKQNVVAHARITGREDAAGKRVLFIEELQSDWHQKGRDQGYQQPADPVAQEEARLALTAATAARDAARTDFAEEVVAEGEVLLARLQASQEKAKASLGAEGDAVLAERIAKLNGALNTITDQLAAKEFWRAALQANFLTYNAANGLGKTEAMQAAIDRLEQAQLAALEAEVAYDAASGETGIPDAPWKKSWDALLMKRMIRYAVDNGFEQIAWINGNQQNGGQTGGDGSFFYERNLVNTTNDIIKKFGTRVEKVDMRTPVDREKIIAERAAGEQTRRELLAEDQATGDDFLIARSQAGLDRWLEQTRRQLAGDSTSPYIDAAAERIAYAEETNRPEDAQTIREEVEAERARLLRPATKLGIQNGFVITPELRDAAMSGFAMFQQNRGQIAFGKDISQTPSVISLLKTADLSTFLHETGHFFLEATLHLANMPDADAVSVADANILMRWFAPDMTLEKWAGMTLEEKTPYHERFARGFEAYLFEGKAPSTEMRSLFRTFSSWLKSVYKSLTELNVELTDDVRGVMDRMLASEAEIEDAQQVWALSALYDQKPEGMTEDEWARLQALGRDATEEAVEQLERRSVRDMKWASGAKSRALRQLQDEAEELRKAVRAEVTAEVMAEPVNRARNFLRRGLGEDGEPVEGAAKLDLETLKALYGEEPARPTGPERLVSRPPEGPLWTKLRRGGKYGEVGTDGLHPDIVAGWFGYPSGEALIEDLVNGENAAEKIKGLTDQRMLERHGDLTDPQSIDKAANEAVANEARVKFVAAEEAYAAKAAGKKSLLAEAAKAIADRVVSRLTLKNLKPAQYISAQIRASRAARKAATKGDAVGVATAKRTQLINLHTGRAVAAARKEVEKDLRLFARIVTAKDASLARSRNMDLVNAARAILAKYGVGRVKNDVAGYIKAVQTYDPELFADLASVFGDLVNPERPLNELTYGEYVAVRDAVRQLWQQSRQSKVIEIDGQQRTIESVVGELNAQMDEIQPDADVAAPETTPSKSDRLGHEILGVRAMMRRVESWARGVDVRVQGPFIRYIWNPISEASDRYRRDSAAYLRRLNELMETMREDMKPRDIAAPELGFVFKSKAVLYHAMLHTGNLSNKTKLLLGYGWGKRTEDGQLDDSRWQAFMDRLHAEGVITERDWAFVQSVWDLLEETKPGAQRAHHIMYGRYFDEITADPVVTPFGTLRGGYVPALTESYFVQDAMLRSGEDGLESNAASQMFPSTGNGFTKGRVENYTQPLSLELGLLSAHLDKVVKFTHLGPAVRQAMRLLKNRKLAARLKAFDPTAQTDLLLPWLQRAAKQTVEAQGIGSGGKWVDRTARYLRGTAGMQLMFANVINTMQQLVGGPLVAAARVKPARLGQALWRYMRDPAGVSAAAAELSVALATRMDNQIMETRQNINEIIDLDPTALGSARQWAIRHGYFMQTAVQNIMDPIIWTAAFDQATSEGQSTDDAVRFANSVLRETQGSWNPEDVSRLETGPPAVRAFTMFAGWANMLANLSATETQIVARGVGVRKGAGRLFYIYLTCFAGQALIGQAISDLMRGGWDDDEEDGYLDEALNWFFASQLKLGLSAVPIAGPLANAALGGFTEARFDDRLSVSPVLSLLEGAALSPAAVYDSVVKGEKFNRADVRNVLTLLGLVSGLPLVPLAKPLGYAADVINEDVEPTGPLDAARGAITGAPSPGSKTQ